MTGVMQFTDIDWSLGARGRFHRQQGAAPDQNRHKGTPELTGLRGSA